MRVQVRTSAHEECLEDSMDELPDNWTQPPTLHWNT
jgi:hypothetical protein